MDASARTLTASLILITTAALIARSFSAALTSPGGTTDSQRVKRKSKPRRSQKNDEPRYVAGLVNVGNTCFMNAVLQALASLPSLKEYLQDRNDIGHDSDSITLALYETVEMLNIIYRRPTSKRLTKMITTIKAKAAHVLTSQQQDAQELFQILSTQLSEEREKVDHATTLSLSEILDPLSRAPSSTSASEKSPRSARQSSVSVVRVSSLSSSTILTTVNRNNQQPQPPPSSTIPTIAVQGEIPERVNSNDNGGDYEGQGQGLDTSTLMTSSLMLDMTEQEKYKRAKSPFMGLLASRVSCVDCGYTAAIRHSTFDSLSLTVPLQYSCSLEQCLDSFIHLDTISDFNCRKCTLLGASMDLGRKIEQGTKVQKQREQKEQEGKVQQPMEQIQHQMNSNTTTTNCPADNQHQVNDIEGHAAADEPTSTQDTPPARTKRRRSSRLLSPRTESSTDNKDTSTKPGKISLAEMGQMKAKVDQCLASDIEMDLAPIELTPVQSKRTTKHSMVAKPPQALCLHLNRSMFNPSGQLAKNPCKVVFESRLDFTRFTTSGYLTTIPTKSMSRRGSLSETVSSNKVASLTNGRIPLTSSASFSGSLSSTGLKPWPGHHHPSRTSVVPAVNSTEQDGDGNDGDEDGDQVAYHLWSVVVHMGSHNSGHFVTYRRIPSSADDQPTREVSNDDKWWRISDEDVQIVEWSLVKNAEAYMLFYEKE
ncbi:hypothetical protein BGZ95_003991 [Linnemannia exigua]|uniref:Ubiquitin carboxyl-terminal hydrolase n=1 Tax=Linnemannia exigua TaxID=604196 RepID=A0AAD4D5N4_9FUNG|nr:hypothetical protein BGZ95_003991 [Linnemannia exigua]